MMKSMVAILLLGMISLASPAVQAQISQEEVAVVQNLFGMEKRAVYAKIMKLSSADSVSFWPLYDAYEVKRKDLGKKKIELAQAFVNKYPNISHAEIDELVEKIDDVNEDLRELIKDYYEDIRDKSSAQTGAMFYQMEQYIMNVVSASLSDSLPFIGEFNIVTTKKK